VDREVRETFESAMALGRAATQLLGATDEVVAGIEASVRRNDVERLDLEMAGGMNAGKEKILGNLEHGH
jgi:glutathione-regulated potassium-efflux system protein KefB